MSSLNQNQLPNEDVTLKDLLDLHAKTIKLSLNCHHIGTIKSFNSSNQTARVQIAYKKTYLEPNPVTKIYTLVQKEYPLLLDCPVIFLGGGGRTGGSLTFPVANGDECLVLFNDRAIDNWFAGNTGAEVASSRLHAIADGLCLVGIRSAPNALSGFDTDGVALRMGTNTKLLLKNSEANLQIGENKVQVKSNEITATLSTGVTLKVTSTGKFSVTNVTGEFIATLLDALASAKAGGDPLILNPAFVTILNSFKA